MATLLRSKCLNLKSYPLKKAIVTVFKPTRSSLLTLSTSSKMYSQHWQQEGIPGSNMPFSSSKKNLFTIGYLVFFGVGMAAPLILLRRYLLILNTPAPVVENQVLTQIICNSEQVQE